MAVRNSIVYSRKTGIITAFGFAIAIGIHALYSLLGFAAIISKSIVLFSLIKYAGAAYLIYIGIKALRSKGFNQNINAEGHGSISSFVAFRDGFVTNLFNPKAAVYFLALFSQFITPETPVEVQIIYSLTCIVLTAIWFSFVAIFLTNRHVRKPFLAFSQWIDRVCGGLLIALGIKLIFEKGLKS